MKCSVLVFACYSAACRPPTSGGTGGSKPGGSTRTKRFDRAVRSKSQAVKAAAESALANSIYSGGTKIYHGSSASIQPGDKIKPGESPGAAALGHNRVAFATRNLLTGKVFAGRSFGSSQTHIYEVEPIKKDLKFLASEELGVHVASPSGFRVVRRLDPSEHPGAQVNPYGVTRSQGVESRLRQELISQTRTRKSPPRRTTKNPEFDEKLKRIGESLRAKRDANDTPEMKAAIDKLTKAIYGSARKG